MCVTMSSAVLSDTIVYCGLTSDGDHLLGYQNKAQNLNPNKKANVMILPIPSIEELGPKNVFDLSKDTKLLQDMKKVIDPLQKTRRGSRGSDMTKGSYNIFKSGNYQIITATDALTAKDALNTHFSNKDIPFSLEVANAYYEWYPSAKWEMLLAVWEGQDEMQSDPILIKYKPSNPDNLFMPGLDSHTGKYPNLQHSVRRDHVLIVGHEKMKYKLSDSYPLFSNKKVSSFLPGRFNGFVAREQDSNCDWLVSTKALEQGKLGVIKYQPSYFEVE